MNMLGVALSQIVVYPVKSLAGISVPAWPVVATGLRYDRQWMLVDEKGLFLSQRRLPKLALLNTELLDDHFRVSGSGGNALELSLVPPDTGDTLACTIWGESCQAWRVSDAADAWFSEALQQPCRLVYWPETAVRAVDPDYALASDRTAFSDGFPFLLVSESSLTDLNKKLAEPVAMNRFRPNLVVSGCAGYAEDRWRQIRIGDIEFRLPKPCARCVIPTIDPETAVMGKEPLATLMQTRKWQNKIYFGQNALHDHTGILQVGDRVTVLSQGEAQPPL